MDRLETLRQMVDANPGNSFMRYGLAMEYVNRGSLQAGVDEFAALLGADPKYAAAYYHGGQTLEKMGKLDEARDFYRRGIAVAGDAHARAELQAALDILGD